MEQGKEGKGNGIVGRFAWKDFPKLQNADDLENYIKYTNSKNPDQYRNLRAYNHGSFFHYSKLGSIDKILGSKSFLLFNPGKSNDPMEEGINDRQYKFIFSFSTGIHENIPMWYLYGGMDGQGGCLILKKKQVSDIINNGHYSLVQLESKNRRVVDNSDISLSKGDYQCKLQDIVYCQCDKNAVFLKYNTMTNHEESMAASFEKF